jgi:hypothetical protein
VGFGELEDKFGVGDDEAKLVLAGRSRQAVAYLFACLLRSRRENLTSDEGKPLARFTRYWTSGGGRFRIGRLFRICSSNCTIFVCVIGCEIRYGANGKRNMQTESTTQ